MALGTTAKAPDDAGDGATVAAAAAMDACVCVQYNVTSSMGRIYRNDGVMTSHESYFTGEFIL